MRLRRWSLRTRLVVALVALLAVVCALVGAATFIALQRYQMRQLDAQLQAAASRVPRWQYGQTGQGGQGSQSGQGQTGQGGPYAGPYGAGGTAGAGVPFWLSSRCTNADAVPASSDIWFLQIPGQGPGTLAASIDASGAAEAGYVDASGCTHQLTSSLAKAIAGLATDGAPHTLHVGPLGAYRIAAVPGPDSGRLITGVPLGPLQATGRKLIEVELVVSGLALLVAALAAAAIIRGALRPLRRVAATATRVSAMPLDRGEVDLAVRVPPRDTDPRTETGQVGSALNLLLDNVGSALAARHDSEVRVRQFVADASHELRTPLASIRGYSELVNRDPQALPPEAARAMGRIESQARRMSGLVEDLLLLARLDSGRPLESATVDLTQLVVDAVTDAAAAGPERTWSLDVPDEPVEVTGDAARLHQVLANLLTNARTHTAPETAITATLRRDEGGGVVVAVVDDGPGISADLLPHVFDRFARGEASRSRATGSSGLGLAIVSAIVGAQGGSVTVSSRPGQTAFVVTLPAAPPPGSSRERPATIGSSRGRPTPHRSVTVGEGS